MPFPFFPPPQNEDDPVGIEAGGTGDGVGLRGLGVGTRPQL